MSIVHVDSGYLYASIRFQVTHVASIGCISTLSAVAVTGSHGVNFRIIVIDDKDGKLNCINECINDDNNNLVSSVLFALYILLNKPFSPVHLPPSPFSSKKNR